MNTPDILVILFQISQYLLLLHLRPMLHDELPSLDGPLQPLLSLSSCPTNQMVTRIFFPQHTKYP